MVARMLEGVEVRLNEDYLADKTKWDALAEKEEKVIFGGRLGEYKYYDMDQMIAAALERVEGLEWR